MTKKNLKTLRSVGPSGLPRAALDKRWSSYASKAVVKEEEEARVGGVRDGGVSEVRQPLLLKEEKRLRPLPSSFPSALSTFVFLLASTLQSSVGRGRNQVDLPKKYHNHRLLSRVLN